VGGGGGEAKRVPRQKDLAAFFRLEGGRKGGGGALIKKKGRRRGRGVFHCRGEGSFNSYDGVRLHRRGRKKKRDTGVTTKEKEGENLRSK